QTHRIETPRLGHARAPRQKGGPRHVAFDFLHELVDPRRGGFGLSALDANKQRLLLVIRKPDVDGATGHQGQADSGDEHGNIFPEQPSSEPPRTSASRLIRKRLHSITSPSALRKSRAFWPWMNTILAGPHREEITSGLLLCFSAGAAKCGRLLSVGTS